MREVFLAISVIGMFAFAFCVAARIGGFLEVNFRGAGTQQAEDKSVSVTFVPGQTPAETAARIRKLGNACDRCAVLVCGAEAPDVMDYIDPDWCVGDSRYQIG